jgi:hypothetical protein
MNKTSWIRAGIIGGGLYIVIEVLVYIFGNSPTSIINPFEVWSYFPFGFIYETFSDLVGLPSYTPLPSSIIIILNIFTCSLIGILINFIYRKIKN